VLENGRDLPIALGRCRASPGETGRALYCPRPRGGGPADRIPDGKEQGKPRRLLDKNKHPPHQLGPWPKQEPRPTALEGLPASGRSLFKTRNRPGGSDALAIGTDGRYIIGVWTGNSDRRTPSGQPGLRNDAAPSSTGLFDRYHEGELKRGAACKPPPAAGKAGIIGPGPPTTPNGDSLPGLPAPPSSSEREEAISHSP
jgi:hypothetical protein